MKTFIRLSAGGLILLATAVVLLFIAQIRIPLGPLVSTASFLLTSLTDKKLSIDGEYYLTPGEWIILEIKNGSMRMSEEGGASFTVSIPFVQTGVKARELFEKVIFLSGIKGQGISVTTFQGTAKKVPEQLQDVNLDTVRRDPVTVKQIGDVDLTDITLSLIRQQHNHTSIIHLDEVKGAIYDRTPGRMAVNGVVNGRQLEATFESGPLETYRQNTPLAFTAHLKHKSIKASAKGYLKRAANEHNHKSSFSLSLSGESLNDLTSVFGRQSSENIPFSLKSKIVYTPGELEITVTDLRPGANGVSALVKAQSSESGIGSYSLKVEGKTIDLDELDNLLASPTRSSRIPDADRQGKNGGNVSTDDILVPHVSISASHAAEISLEKLVIAGHSIKDLRIKAVSQNGTITDAPFSAVLKNSSLEGSVSLNLNSEKPKISIKTRTQSWNIGEMLEDFNLAQGVELFFENVSSSYATSGQTLRELGRNLTMHVQADNGSWEVRDPNTGAVMPVIIKHVELTAEPGRQIHINLVGNINDNKVEIITAIDDLRGRSTEEIREVPFFQRWQINGAKLELEGNLPFPVKLDGTLVKSRFSGKKLSDLSDLVRLRLPEVGPYDLAGNLKVTKDGYELSSISISVGSSELTGDLVLDTGKVPPRLSLEMVANTIQMTDFKRKDADHPEILKKTGKEKTAVNKKENPRYTDQKNLYSYDADIAVKVKQLFSGRDYLGSGLVKVKQERGAFEISPLVINFPKGEATLKYSIQPAGDKQSHSLTASITDLDYGIVGRWFKPETDIGGIVSFRTSLRAESQDFKGMMRNASGYVDFSIQPLNIRAGVIDYWAINLFSFLIPFITPNNESKLNCFAGRFNIDDGILREDEILVDTTRMEVRGTAEVNFRDQLINVVLRPIPKRPQFYSLATPIEISGSFDDIDAGVARGGLIGTFIRLATSFIVVPIQWIILDKLPQDNTEKCLKLVQER